MLRVATLGFATLLALAAAAPHPADARQRADITAASACPVDAPFRTGDLAFEARENPQMPPKRGAAPVSVDIGVYVEQLTQISETDHSFMVQAFVDLVWCDPRLAYASGSNTATRRVLLEEEAASKLSTIWWPDLTFVNAAEPIEKRHEELILFPDGTVVYEEEISGRFQARMDLTQFPFDRHIFPIELESFAWSIADMILVVEENKIGFAEDFNTPSWRLTGHSAVVENVQEIRDRDPFSKFKFHIHADRISEPYVFRLIMPLVLIVIASWSVFWLRPTSTGRFGVTFTTILTVVAFNLIIGQKLPNVSEITYLEAVFGFCFLLLMLVVVENTVIDNLTRRGEVERATKLDRLAAILFPMSFVAALAVFTIGFNIQLIG